MARPQPTTEQRFLNSTMASYCSQLARSVVRMGADMALMRLILPEAHGLFDIALPVVVLAGLVRDLGLPYQLVRDKGRPYGSVLLWELGAGVFITLLLVLCAPLTLVIWPTLDPLFPHVLRLLSLYVLLEALALVPKIFFERELAVTRMVLPEVVRGLTYAGVAIGMAALNFGVWSFVAGELFGFGALAALLWRRAWGKIPLELDPKPIARMLKSSILLFPIALLAMSMSFVGVYVVKAFDSIGMVAQYTKAFLWASRLQMLLVPAFVRVLYPALVEYKNDHRRFVGAYRIGTVSILALEAMAAYFLFFNAEIVMTRIIGNENWFPAVGLIRILCFAPLVKPFARLGGEMLKVHCQDRFWLMATFLDLTSLIVFGIVLTRWLGTSGMAWANYLGLGGLLLTWRVYRICGQQFLGIARDLALVYAIPVPFFLTVGWLFPGGSWVRFVASLGAAGLSGLVLLLLFYKPVSDFFHSRASHDGEEQVQP